MVKRRNFLGGLAASALIPFVKAPASRPADEPVTPAPLVALDDNSTMPTTTWTTTTNYALSVGCHQPTGAQCLISRYNFQFVAGNDPITVTATGLPPISLNPWQGVNLQSTVGEFDVEGIAASIKAEPMRAVDA